MINIDINIINQHSKSIRREMKRLHDDRESAFRILQQLENNVRDYKDKLTQLGYKLDTKKQVENSIASVQKNSKELTAIIKVKKNIILFHLNYYYFIC